ncbi:hypothetical protein PPL_02459 [Heterostelium album PN500]|uniref:Uncharacterized protein n=1 Tax=Heterostelium pallidum (strain ATCC 26659 / Pp 5 / PN500) TaxID=670386 RepID=D3B252_HETP5|nr:hypothetical protein PPL_02459 [Heterostelium album PN500]EFA84427.1 hypothetical protein PPL_02459 [Heterostelium album PN500]|eukprot:XP_020436541.1 hypothetical protein PPL_02459 [Heterostelium album PN500]
MVSFYLQISEIKFCDSLFGRDLINRLSLYLPLGETDDVECEEWELLQ